MAKAVGTGVTAFGSGVVQGTKAVGSGAVNVTTSVASGVVEGTKAVGTGVVEGTKIVGETVVEGGKSVGQGVVQGTKAVGSGVVHVAHTTKDVTVAAGSKVRLSVCVEGQRSVAAFANNNKVCVSGLLLVKLFYQVTHIVDV